MNQKLSKKDLTLEELAFLESEMLKKVKSKEAAWGLWAGLSFFGAHRFFTEDYKYASVMLTTTILPLITIILLVGSNISGIFFAVSIFFLIGSVVWSWIDAFFLNSRITKLNDDIEQTIIYEISNGRG
ncbi:NINE protein [Chengkuizengella sp. SCS-71B]|uniref:NINE protein n=1 Tax=Chengkuizengella sp. SCS-71B TaxID=3115290 RepID=UPI0032C217CA